MQRQVELLGKSTSTLDNYSRCLARMALHFNCNPLELDKEQILDYLYHIKTQSRTPSSSYFKHTVYGLRFAYRAMGMPQKQVFLPKMQFPKKLPVVLSQQEVKRLLKTPGLLKHRLVLPCFTAAGSGDRNSVTLKSRMSISTAKCCTSAKGKGEKTAMSPWAITCRAG